MSVYLTNEVISTTAQNNTTNATTAVSFPCKYYDINGNLVSGYCNRYIRYVGLDKNSITLFFLSHTTEYSINLILIKVVIIIYT